MRLADREQFTSTEHVYHAPGKTAGIVHWTHWNIRYHNVAALVATATAPIVAVIAAIRF